MGQLRSALSLVNLTLVTVVCLAAAPQQQAAGTGVMSGRAIDAGTGQPVARAFMSLEQTAGGGLFESTNADAKGMFSFTGVPAGGFYVWASAEGYLGGAAGRLRPLGDQIPVTLADGEHRKDLTIVMFKAASLSGRVSDENGQPVADFLVQAWPSSHEPVLGRRLPPAVASRTDATGAFHMPGIVPGDYVVVAQVTHETLRQAAPGPSPCAPVPPPMPPGSSLPAPALVPPERPVGTLYSRLSGGLHQPKPSADGRPMTYRTVFFPDVANVDEAQIVTLGSGESRGGIDLQLRPVAATTVRGELTSPKGFAQGGDVRLRLGGDPRPQASDARTWLQPGSGTFSMLDVPAGSYVLEATRTEMHGCDVTVVDSESKLTPVQINVTAAGVDGLVMPLSKGSAVAGSIVLHGTSKPPENLADINLNVRPLDHLDEWPWAHDDGSNQRFRVDDLMPGLYELQAIHLASPRLWWLEKVTSDGRDVTGLPLVVGAADGLENVIVTMTDHASSIGGTVNTSTNQPVADATVVLFPVDRTLWQYARVGALRFQSSRALRGVYEFENVPAGDYFLAAVDETTMDAWPLSAFLERTMASAKRVTVKSGSPQTIWLTMSSAVRR